MQILEEMQGLEKAQDFFDHFDLMVDAEKLEWLHIPVLMEFRKELGNPDWEALSYKDAKKLVRKSLRRAYNLVVVEGKHNMLQAPSNCGSCSSAGTCGPGFQPILPNSP